MNKITWSWIAGFFEGEGSISLIIGKRGTKQGTSGRIIIGQNDKRPLVAIKAMMEAEGFERILLYQRPAKPPKVPNPIWIFAINHRAEVIRFLVNVAPMLFEKKSKAMMVCAYLKKMDMERDVALRKAMRMKVRGMTWGEVADKCGIGRKALRNYAMSKGISLSKE